jgi:hypothetical protein
LGLKRLYAPLLFFMDEEIPVFETLKLKGPLLYLPIN